MSQGMFFLHTFMLGAGIAFIFDVFRAFRQMKKYKTWAVHLQDALFWLITALIVLYFILNDSDGEIRFFFILGIGCGGLLYFNTISRYMRALLVAILKGIQWGGSVCGRCFDKILDPLLLLVKTNHRHLKNLFKSAVKEPLQKSHYYEKIRKASVKQRKRKAFRQREKAKLKQQKKRSYEKAP